MRKIGSEKQDEKRKKIGVMIVGILLVGLMAFSVLGFAFIGGHGGIIGGSEEQLYGQEDYFNGQYWVTNVEGQIFYFSNPLSEIETEQVNFENFGTLSEYLGSVVYVASDNEEIANKLLLNLGRYANRIQPACYGPCEEDLPEIDCTENLVVYTSSEQNRIYREDKCVFVEGESLTADVFLYKFLGFN